MTSRSRKEYIRKYQKRWISNRRKSFFKGKKCNWCGAAENLELDHIDSSKKVTHRIWSWCEERRSHEISKCQILCKSCHTLKTKVSGDVVYKSNSHPSSKLNSEDIIFIRQFISSGGSRKYIMEKYAISKHSVSNIVLKKRWKHVD